MGEGKSVKINELRSLICANRGDERLENFQNKKKLTNLR